MSNEHAPRPRPERLERKLAAILHADVQGYSRLLGEDEEATLRTVAAHLALMRTLVEQHGGLPLRKNRLPNDGARYLGFFLPGALT